MDKLKPCPFCDGEAFTVCSEHDWWHVECHDCCARSGKYGTREYAIKTWNTRADDQSQAAAYWRRMYEETVKERTCKMEAAGGLKYKHGGTGSEAKKLFGTEWRTMEKSKCTVCHKVTMHDDTIAYSYCPHCGAKVVE